MGEPQLQSKSSTSFPFIQFRPYGKPIVNLDINFFMKRRDNTGVKLGEAYVQIIDEKDMPGSMLDYCIDRYDDYEGRKDRLKSMIDILSRVQGAHESIKGKLAFLHLAVLLPEYRKKGLSIPFFSMVLQALKQNMNVDYVLLEAWPLELNRFDKVFEQEKKRLEKIYSKFGFIKRSYQNKSFMFLNLNNWVME